MSLFNSFSHRMILYLLENFQIFLKNGVQSHINFECYTNFDSDKRTLYFLGASPLICMTVL